MKLRLSIIMILWMPMLAGAAHSSESNQNLQQFLALSDELQGHISKYLLSGEIKRDLFDKPIPNRILRGYEQWPSSVELNNDKTQIVSAGNSKTVHIWDIQTGHLIRILRHKDYVNSASFNQYGNQVVSTSRSIIRIWDVLTGQRLHTLQGHQGLVRSAAFNKAATQIVSAGTDGTARIWNAQTGQPLHVLYGHEKWALSASFNQDGTHVLSAGNDGTMRIWDVRTGQPLYILRGHERLILSASFNQDGTQVVSTNADNTIHIWDIRTGQLLHILRGHENYIRSIAFNKKGTLIISASNDATVRMWDTQTGQLLHILHGHKNGAQLAAFNKDETKIVSASNNSVHIWDLELPYNRYHFNLEQALWIYNRYHEIMAGKKNKKRKKEQASTLSQATRDQIIRTLAIEQSIKDKYPEILDRLQTLQLQQSQHSEG